MSEPGLERLDPADLVLRKWVAEDRLIRHARRLGLDVDLVERMESAALRGDSAALEGAVADLLEEIAARAG